MKELGCLQTKFIVWELCLWFSVDSKWIAAWWVSESENSVRLRGIPDPKNLWDGKRIIISAWYRKLIYFTLHMYYLCFYTENVNECSNGTSSQKHSVLTEWLISIFWEALRFLYMLMNNSRCIRTTLTFITAIYHTV